MDLGARAARVGPGPSYDAVSDQIRSVEASPAPRASACGMGIVHTFLTQEVSDNPAGSRGPGGTGGLEVDETYVLI